MMFYHGGSGSGMQRPPSRHKDPPQNLGLDLPGHNPDEFVNPSVPMILDDDSDSGDAFEIGIAKANKKSVHQYLLDDDSMDSLVK